MKTTRYPGTQSFDSTQRNIFFGRDKDISKLTEMIELERMVLVYAKSGIGKTSLINAGVLPSLEERNDYTFHSVRFGAWTASATLSEQENGSTPHDIAAKSFSKLNESQNYLDKIIYKDNSLWYFSKMWQLQQERENKKNETLLLIFDQFEELFTYPQEAVTQFKKELAELLFTVVPQRFADQKELLEDIKPSFISEKEEKLLFEQPKVKILFAIRSDRMSQLNKMSDYIPRILLKHYELAPLTDQQAIAAIEKPAQLEGDFSSPKFTYQKEALSSIMQFLTKKGTQTDNIESFQLQILCQVVERRVKAGNLREIIPVHIEPVKDIYQNFYDDLIKGLSLSEKKKMLARIMIEDGLIEEATQRRLQISGEQIALKFKIDNEILFQLVNERLLRTEEHDNFRLYELSHDTLVEPILESRKLRVEKEEEAKAELERLEEVKKLTEERAKQRKITTLMGFAALISILFAIFGLWQMKIAKESQAELRKKTIIGYIRDAKSYMDKEEYKVALEKYYYLRDEILEGKSDADFQKRIDECKRLEKVSTNFYIYVNEADSLMNTNTISDFVQAGELYAKADSLDYKYEKIDFEEKYLKPKLESYHKQLTTLISENISEAETLLKVNEYRNQAKNIYNELKQLAPNDKRVIALGQKL